MAQTLDYIKEPTELSYLQADETVREMEKIKRPLTKAELERWELNTTIIANYIYNDFRKKGLI
jgi:hypothetical protein